MNLLIYLEGERLTLSKDVETSISYAIDDIRDFSSRQTSFSKTIILAGDANNNRIFGHLFDVSVENPHDVGELNVGVNYNPLRSAECQVFRDGLQILNGVLKVDRVTIIDGVPEYECNLFGKLAGLSSAIGEKRLEDLDFSEYDHQYNETNIVNSWAAATGSGYFYPLIDDGRTTDGINWDLKSFKPAFHVKEYLDKIFAAAGWTYSSDFINSDFFKKLIIPSPYASPDIEAEKLFDKARLTDTSVDFNYKVVWEVNNSTSYVTDSAGSLTNNRADNANVELAFDVDYEAQRHTGSGATMVYSAILKLTRGGVTSTLKTVSDTVNNGLLFQGALSGSVTIPLQIGDVIELHISSTTNVSLGGIFNLQYANLRALGQPTIKFSAAFGDVLPMSAFIPKEVKQIDFIKSIATMFNLYVTDDQNKEKHVIITPYKDFYYTDAYLDWSDKVDLSKARTVQPTASVVGVREFLFTYKRDADYYNEVYYKKYGTTYGERKIDTGIEFLKEVKKIEVLFGSSPLTQWSGTTRVHTAIFKQSNGVKEQFTSMPRILLRSTTALACGSWTLKDGATTLTTLTTYGYAGHLDSPTAPTIDLNFGAPAEVYFKASSYPTGNLFNIYWDYYVAETTDKDSKYLTLNLRLNDVDIANLDFARIIFIGGTLYRLSKINDYNAGGLESTKIELIKVVNIQ